MSAYNSMMNLSLEELKDKYLQSTIDNKPLHDMAALGVSPRHMVMYTESIRLIKEYEDTMKERLT